MPGRPRSFDRIVLCLRAGSRVAAGLLVVGLIAACTTRNVSEPPTTVQPRTAVIPVAPDTADGAGLDALGRQVDSTRPRVALLLPLSGQAASVGRSMQNAAEMALFDAGVQNFTLIPRDTGGTPAGAEAAARAAMQDGAQLVLGPLFSESVTAAGRVAAASGVNVVAFTTDSMVAGGNVLIMGRLPVNQIDRVVTYSQQQGLNTFGLLAPDDRYGRAVSEALQDVAQRRGAGLSRVQFYATAADNAYYSSVVRDMVQSAGYDALMIPDTGLRLRQVASLVPYYGLRRAQLLGTGIWDGENVGVEQALRGALYAAPQPDLATRQSFEVRYRELYGAPAPSLATLAYDAVGLAIYLSQNPTGTTPFSMTALTNPNGFTGADGIFRFRTDGRVERGLAVMRVTADGAEVVDPAPGSFVGAGF